jgi:hypothetical protein
VISKKWLLWLNLNDEFRISDVLHWNLHTYILRYGVGARQQESRKRYFQGKVMTGKHKTLFIEVMQKSY